MKQAEFEKLQGKIARNLSKKYGWKSSSGFVFKREGKVFFTIVWDGQPKTRSLYWLFQFKYYEFDDLFWKIVKLEENSLRPLSFRARGVWIAPSMKVSVGSEQLDEWNETNIFEKIDEIIDHIDSTSVKISESIVSPESNLAVIEQYYQSIQEQDPDTLTDIWVEKLLTYLLLGKNEEAKNLAQERINKGDSGRFGSDGKPFFELALEYIEALPEKY